MRTTRTSPEGILESLQDAARIPERIQTGTQPTLGGGERPVYFRAHGYDPGAITACLFGECDDFLVTYKREYADGWKAAHWLAVRWGLVDGKLTALEVLPGVRHAAAA